MNTHGVSAAIEVTVVVLITGDVITLSRAAKQLLFDLRYYAERDQRPTQILVVLDGPLWREHISTDDLSITGGRVLDLPAATEHPGRMLNAALDDIATGWVAVLGIGTEISTWYSNLAEWHKVLSATNAEMVAGYRSVSEGRSAANESFLTHQNDGFSSDYPHAWLQMLDLVPMSNTMTRRDLIRQVGGFTEAASLQRMWWWEFCLRVSRSRKIQSIPLQPVPGPNWHQFSFGTPSAAPPERSLQQLMHLEAEALRTTPAREDELNNLAGDVASLSALRAKSPSWRSLPSVLQQSLHRAVTARGRPLEILVVGGVNEPAHNQLCFFNYFAQMRSWGVLNWRAVLDERATAEDIAGCDLVIFSRVRNANGVALMEACVSHDIRTLYMLDDNWFWLGREWDEYAPIFSPGAEPYENFISLVRQANVALTYRDPLADDLRPHAKRVVTLPTNVDLNVFARGHLGIKSSRRKKIGYVGSLRKNMVAFEALVNIARSRDDVDIFVMSNSLPEEFATLPAGRVHFEPYQFNYAAYAATVVAAAPDVLVAPVGRTRFEASKCPNKYLEISAAGAVGVYSNAEPYTTYVRNGETGLFADDTVQSWTAAITRLLDDESLRVGMARAARAHVSTEFDTAAVLPRFTEMLLDALDGRT
jgi:glycosyltransferase involved in cell wall biosynthesis